MPSTTFVKIQMRQYEDGIYVVALDGLTGQVMDRTVGPFETQREAQRAADDMKQAFLVAHGGTANDADKPH